MGGLSYEQFLKIERELDEYFRSKKERGMGAPYDDCAGCEDCVPPMQEEAVESKESQEEIQIVCDDVSKAHREMMDQIAEDAGMFSKEARKVLGWEHGLERFYELLVQMGRIHSKKNRDYTSIHPLENFFRVAMNVGISPENVVEVMVATKSARIKSLLEEGVDPQNESLLDSYLDRAVYSILGAAIHEMSDEEQARLCERIATEDLFVEGEDEAE